MEKRHLDWSGRTVLVTGADGFIGSHLTEALVARGAKVTALALYNSFDAAGWLDDLPAMTRESIRIVRGDIRDPHQMLDVCRRQEIVFHLAALISIPFSYDAPSSYVQTNIQGTINILKGALASSARRVVHTSTSEVYGTARFTPISEAHPLQGQSPYSASKIGADMVAESFARSFDLPVVTLRPFNTYGPRQSERAVIGATIRQALDDRCDAIRVGDLSPKRDFTFVADMVEAFLAVAKTESLPGAVFNAGSGRMMSVGEAVDIIRAATNSKKPLVQERERFRPPASEVMALMADASRLKAAAGWSPRITMEDGIRATVAWWHERLTKVRPNSTYII